MAVSVQLRGVTKRFGETVAVAQVDLKIERGEFFFLLGPSGCGKTTLLRVVAGFYEPEEGEIYFDDRPMHGVPPHRRNTGMVFQNYALWPHMTVYENVEYGLALRKVPPAERKRRVMEALETVQMERYADRTPNQLSGGQQQRVALARAIVIEPDVLLLDEPLSNLDARLRDEMRQELRRIHQQTGLTALYVTHDQREALSLATRMAIMRDGRIAQIGTPREVYTEPTSAFVATFIGDTNLLSGRVLNRDGGGLTVETEVGTVFVSRARNFQVGDRVLLSVRPEALHLAAEKQGRPNEFPARVLGTTYLGSLEEYELAVNDALRVTALLYNPGRTVYAPDQNVFLSFDPADVVPLVWEASD
ncbi:MAG: spermidine/putrescine ABC transporter ATP-binding protein [Candidatus Poribacteria bacterium]|nr:MAG: spermidine/putrescine ABC transporter ATP-binding protein [Candidatus Poribacteria bacterium]